MKPIYLILFLTCVFMGCSVSRNVAPTPTEVTQSAKEALRLKIDQEFRAAWVATVANINWPSKPGLPVELQQQEAIALLAAPFMAGDQCVWREQY